MVVCVSLKVDNVWTTMPLGTSNFTVITEKNYTEAHQKNSKTALHYGMQYLYILKLEKSTSFMIAWDEV